MAWEQVAAVAGPPIISWLLNRISGSPRREAYEGFIEQQSPVLGQLRKQALGQPSLASRFIESRLQQASRQAKQTAAAASTRNRLGTQSTIARQRQINQQSEQRLDDLLGQLMLGSQQQYGQLMGQVGGMRAGMAEAEMGRQASTAQAIGNVLEAIINEYTQNKMETGETDNDLENAAAWLRDQLSGIYDASKGTYGRFSPGSSPRMTLGGK